MKRYISFIVLISYINLIALPCFAQTGKSEVLEVSDDLISSNVGYIDGVKEGDNFLVKRRKGTELITIAKAKVLVVKDKISALKIIELKPDYNILIGDIIVKYEPSSILEEARVKQFDKKNLTSKVDYYSLGKKKASSEYSGVGHFIVGLVIGFATGLIGWLIGFIVVSSRDVNVPNSFLVNLNSEQRMEFINGYERKVKSKRKLSFTFGSLLGVAGVVVLIISTNR